MLERDGWVCQIQAPNCVGHSNEVDHVGAPDDHRPEQLRAVCTPCHRTRTGRQARDRQGYRARPAEPHPGMIN